MKEPVQEPSLLEPRTLYFQRALSEPLGLSLWRQAVWNCLLGPETRPSLTLPMARGVMVASQLGPTLAGPSPSSGAADSPPGLSPSCSAKLRRHWSKW